MNLRWVLKIAFDKVSNSLLVRLFKLVDVFEIILAHPLEISMRHDLRHRPAIEIVRIEVEKKP